MLQSIVVRKFWIIALLVSFLLIAESKIADSQLIDKQVGTLKDGSWIGIQVNVSWPEPVGTANDLIAIPVGLTVFEPFPNAHFIETGPIKNCIEGMGDCQFHPYTSWATPGLLTYQMRIDTTKYLGSNQLYGYKVERTASSPNGNNYTTFFCSSVGCIAHWVVGLSLSEFPLLWVAGESNGPRWLAATISSAKGKNVSNVYDSYCYNPSLNYVTVVDGRITQCDNSSWQISWEHRANLPMVNK